MSEEQLKELERKDEEVLSKVELERMMIGEFDWGELEAAYWLKGKRNWSQVEILDFFIYKPTEACYDEREQFGL